MEEKTTYVPRTMNPEEIKDVRINTGLSQRNFCIRYGLPIATLRNWEQGRTCPDIAASLFLYQLNYHALKDMDSCFVGNSLRLLRNSFL